MRACRLVGWHGRAGRRLVPPLAHPPSRPSWETPVAGTILTLDLGKYKTLPCAYDHATASILPCDQPVVAVADRSAGDLEPVGPGR